MDRLRSLGEREIKVIKLQRTPRRWILNEDGIATVITVESMGTTNCWKLFCQQLSKIECLESVSVDGRIRKLI